MRRHDGLSAHCATGRHGPQWCTGCTCPADDCHPDAVRVSHGAPVTDPTRTRALADTVRAAAGLPTRHQHTRAA
jgi:hypothetical protein